MELIFLLIMVFQTVPPIGAPYLYQTERPPISSSAIGGGGPGAGIDNLLLVDGTSSLLLVDGSSVLLLQ